MITLANHMRKSFPSSGGGVRRRGLRKATAIMLALSLLLSVLPVGGTVAAADTPGALAVSLIAGGQTYTSTAADNAAGDLDGAIKAAKDGAAPFIGGSDDLVDKLNTISELTITVGTMDDNDWYYLSGNYPAKVPSSGAANWYGTESNFKNLKKLTLEENVDLLSNPIPNNAFRSSNGTIGSYPQSVRLGLESLTINCATDSIGDNVFAYLNKLKTVTMPKLRVIPGLYMFVGALATVGSDLSEVYMPELTTITGSNTFYGARTIESISFPKLTAIQGSSAANTFNSCAALKSVDLPLLETIDAGISGSTFSGCAALESIALPSLTTLANDNIFAGCTGLKTVALPKLYDFDYTETFLNKSTLDTLVLSSDVPDLAVSAASNLTANNTTVYVPSAKDRNAYIEQPNWDDGFTLSAVFNLDDEYYEAGADLNKQINDFVAPAAKQALKLDTDSVATQLRRSGQIVPNGFVYNSGGNSAQINSAPADGTFFASIQTDSTAPTAYQIEAGAALSRHIPPATGISLNVSELTMDVSSATNHEADLSVTVTPSALTDMISWSVDDNDIVSLTDRSDGTASITALASGDTTVTASIGGLSDNCVVHVEKTVPLDNNSSYLMPVQAWKETADEPSMMASLVYEDAFVEFVDYHLYATFYFRDTIIMGIPVLSEDISAIRYADALGDLVPAVSENYDSLTHIRAIKIEIDDIAQATPIHIVNSPYGHDVRIKLFPDTAQASTAGPVFPERETMEPYSLTWKGSFGGSASDDARNIAQLNNGDYVVAGDTESNDGDFKSLNRGGSDGYVARYSGDGVLKKIVTLGGSGSDSADYLLPTSDGGYIVFGNYSAPNGDFAALASSHVAGSDLFIAKYSAEDSREWIRSYGGSKGDYADKIIASRSGGYLISGLTHSFDNDFSETDQSLGGDSVNLNGKPFVIKLSENFVPEWATCIGAANVLVSNGTLSYVEQGLIELNDGSVVLSGRTFNTLDGSFSGIPHTGSFAAFLLKLDANGSQAWIKKFCTSRFAGAQSITALSDNTILYTGTAAAGDGDFPVASPRPGYEDGIVMKLTADGNIVWQSALTAGYDASDGLKEKVTIAAKFAYETDFGYRVFGDSGAKSGDFAGQNRGGSDAFFADFAADGTLIAVTNIGGSDVDRLRSALPTSDNGWVALCQSRSRDVDFSGLNAAGGYDVTLAKIGGDGESAGPGEQPKPPATPNQNGPDQNAPAPDQDITQTPLALTVANVSISSARATAYNKVNVSWKKIADASGYIVYYKTGSASVWSQKKVAGQAKESVVISGLKTGQRYTFKVKAYRTVGGNTVYSAGYSAAKAATPKLSKATGLKVKKGSRQSLKLSWKKTAGATNYEVWRKAGKSAWKKVKTTTKRSLVQKNLTRGKTYSYRIRAYKTVGKAKSYSPYSAVVKRSVK
ncbi:MAG: leucine-rich repeat protein [Clostridiales Family XIII bacterium]|nr:leucine-rich repeat protein [Clostridiales Family XIII bacterium]